MIGFFELMVWLSHFSCFLCECSQSAVRSGHPAPQLGLKTSSNLQTRKAILLIVYGLPANNSKANDQLSKLELRAGHHYGGSRLAAIELGYLADQHPTLQHLDS